MMARSTTISKAFPNGKTKGLIYKGTSGFNLCQPPLWGHYTRDTLFSLINKGKKFVHARNSTIHTNKKPCTLSLLNSENIKEKKYILCP